MNYSNKLNKIYSIIITYNPVVNDIFLLCKTITDSNINVILIDNTEFLNVDFTSLETLKNVDIFKLNNNLGIAKAQNIGIEYALKVNADIVIFFDQDSKIDNKFLYHLIDPLKMDHVKISAPIFKDYKSQNLIPSIRVSSLGLLTKSNSYSIKFDRFLVISSGMAIKNEVFKVVGFMNEKYFIDYVDTDFCFRCFASNYNIYINCNAIMNHSVGDKMYNFAGLYFFIHKPLRLYYQTRNCIYFLKNKYIPLMYKVREIISFFFHQFVLLLFFYQNKPQYFKAIILGIFHAINGLQGRINESRNMKS